MIDIEVDPHWPLSLRNRKTGTSIFNEKPENIGIPRTYYRAT